MVVMYVYMGGWGASSHLATVELNQAFLPLTVADLKRAGDLVMADLIER